MTVDCFLLVGFGSIGKRHLSNLRTLAPNAKIVLLRRASQVPEGAVAPEGVDHLVTSLEQALAFSPTAAIIAGPATYHMSVAQKLAKEDVHLLVEKPIAAELEGVQQTIDLCRERQLVLMTAYNFRFSLAAGVFRQAVQQGMVGRVLSVCVDTGQFLPSWRVGSDYRQGVSAKKSLGGGVLLELSHEVDYLRWIFGEVASVYARCQNSGSLQIDADIEDCVDMLLVFANGVNANVHLDFIQAVPHRICKVIGTDGTLIWDAVNHEVRVSTLSEPQSRLLIAPQEQRNNMYLDEMHHFIDCIERGTTLAVSGEDGLAALKIVLAAKQSAETNQIVEIG